MNRFLARLASSISWFSRQTGPLGRPIDNSLSPHFYFNKARTKIRYCADGNWAGWESFSMPVHLRTFQVLGTYWAKDRNHIYFKGQPISALPVHIPSFEAYMEEGFEYLALDKNHVYSLKNPNMPHVIEGADPKTYFPFTSSWAKDRSHHYFCERKVEVAYNSFRLHGPHFASDEYRAYYFSHDRFQAFDAHLESLDKLAPHCMFDRQNVYFFHKEKAQLIPIPYHEDQLVLALDDQYIRVGEHIYCNGKLLEDADPLSFKTLKNAYAKDLKNVYWMGLKLRIADPLSFHYNEAQKRFEDKSYLFDMDRAYPKTAF